MRNISIILGSTREGRQGEKVAKWVQTVAASHNDASYDLLDLRDWPLPFYNLAVSADAAKGEYGLAMANQWSARIGKSDGFVIVTPEYNHGYPAVLKNSFDWLFREWNDKPVAFVGYSNGPVSGARSVEQLRQVVIALQMIPIRHDLLLPFVGKQFSETGDMVDEKFSRRLDVMLTHLVEYVELLAAKRA
ncbi:MAG: NAD(P)H-dependent oxidoreductase [bacterium]|nr:NAD(P)H-dependent oxidoreductase [bacterium]